jgi:hypothetical protein
VDRLSTTCLDRSAVPSYGPTALPLEGPWVPHCPKGREGAERLTLRCSSRDAPRHEALTFADRSQATRSGPYWKELPLDRLRSYEESPATRLTISRSPESRDSRRPASSLFLCARSSMRLSQPLYSLAAERIMVYPTSSPSGRPESSTLPGGCWLDRVERNRGGVRAIWNWLAHVPPAPFVG